MLDFPCREKPALMALLQTICEVSYSSFPFLTREAFLRIQPESWYVIFTNSPHLSYNLCGYINYINILRYTKK